MGAIGPYEFQGKFVWTDGPFAFSSGKFVWTNGAESSSKVSSETGSGPWMALMTKLILPKHFFWKSCLCNHFGRNGSVTLYGLFSPAMGSSERALHFIGREVTRR